MTQDQIAEAIAQYTAARPSDELLRRLRLSFLAGGTNPKWRAVTADDAGYVVKVSKNNFGRVPEVNEREALISLLGRLADIPVVDAWVVPLSLFPTVILPSRDEPEAPLVRDRCVVMPLLHGATVAADLSGATAAVGRDPAAAGDLLAFMHWIGDEDRGLDDVMVVQGRLLLIDNGLCGPGSPESTLRGYHPHWEVYNAGAKLKKCYGGKRSFVEFVLRDVGLPHASFAAPPGTPSDRGPDR